MSRVAHPRYRKNRPFAGTIATLVEWNATPLMWRIRRDRFWKYFWGDCFFELFLKSVFFSPKKLPYFEFSSEFSPTKRDKTVSSPAVNARLFNPTPNRVGPKRVTGSNYYRVIKLDWESLTVSICLVLSLLERKFGRQAAVEHSPLIPSLQSVQIKIKIKIKVKRRKGSLQFLISLSLFPLSSPHFFFLH